MAGRWFEIALGVSADVVDEAAALLDWAGYGGVEVRERGDEADVVVVVESDGDGRREAAAAREAVAVLSPSEPRVAELDPKVWTENWKSHFARRVFAGRIEVRPPWDDAPAGENLLGIVINPGMAFGTGLHETTAGCLELLVEEMRPGMRVADVGCGSGILAIAAARLGATDVLATDVDPLAVDATGENIAANDVGSRVRVELEPGEVGIPEWENDARPGLTASRRRESVTPTAASPSIAGPRDSAGTQSTLPRSSASPGDASARGSTPNGAVSGGFAARGRGAFDLVVANILAETLVEMRDALAGAVRDGGVLVLSGIEARRLKMVEEAFIRPGWRLVRTVAKGDWVSLSLHHQALAGAKRSASPASDPAGHAPDAGPEGVS